MIEKKLRALAVVALALSLGGCGCAGSPGKRGEGASSETKADPSRREAWGASFSLTDEWTGGANDAGGFEYTDGDLALLVGHHALEPEQTLESFLEARRRALSDPDSSASFERAEQRIGSSRALTLRGSASAEGGGVEVHLLVARLGPHDGLSLLLIGDSSSAALLEAAWARIVSTLRLP